MSYVKYYMSNTYDCDVKLRRHMHSVWIQMRVIFEAANWKIFEPL